MSTKTFAIVAILLIAVVGLFTISMRPELLLQVGSFIAPVLTTLIVLVRVEDYHVQVNSRMDELMLLAKSAARAEGNMQGRAESRIEAAESRVREERERRER